MSRPEKSKQTFVYGKEKHEDGAMITVKLTCDKECNSSREYSEKESFFEIDHSAYQQTSPVTNNFSHPSKDYVNFISTDLSAQNVMMSTQNNGQNSGR